MMYRLFPTLTANKLQATAYLLGVAFFSISFLVFLNASISFVVTVIIGQKHGVGNAVGTLGFADELLALIACPLWGLLSDRVGVRAVAVTGYIIIGVSLICLVQAQNVYPDLLIGRLGFSIGGAACSTMVTAILPAMTAPRRSEATSRDTVGEEQDVDASNGAQSQGNNRHSLAFSVSSDLTITPSRYIGSSESPLRSRLGRRQVSAKSVATLDESGANSNSGTSQLAGFVGLFTGLGALLAVAVFLPLPARIGGNGTEENEAVKDSFYIVGAIAIVVGFFVLFGLRGLPGEENKGLRNLFNYQQVSQPKEDGRQTTPQGNTVPSYLELVRSAVLLGFTDSNIALGYLGGFVARASSVGISLFIPLFVNAYFIREGLCTDDPSEDIKANCRRAYTLASMLTGVSQLVALICAPIFGWLNGRMSSRSILSSLPLGIGAVVGIVGCIGFGMLRNPDPFSKRDSGGKWAILAVILLGISQIAAIVCSLGLLARGINSSTVSKSDTSRIGARSSEAPRNTSNNLPPIEPAETAPLLPTQPDEPVYDDTLSDRTHLKGTIAGVYSLAGGAGILLLTKLGGFLFDRKSTGAPFFMLAIFNAILLLAIVGIAAGQRLRGQKRDSEEDVS